MEYYLETNSLRQLIPQVDNPVLNCCSYTSILALMEIASGIKDESSFLLRSKMVERVVKSKLAIWIRPPEILILNAFGFDINENELINGIGKVFRIIFESDSFDNFLKNINKSGAFEYYDFLIKYDRNGSSGFKGFFLEKINEVRENTGFKVLIKNYNNRWSSKDEMVAQELYNTLLNHFAKGVYEYQSTFMKKNSRSLEDIKRSYDHSVDVFLIMATLYSDYQISHGSLPGTNDYFDLNHLIYISNLERSIVSDDKLLHRLMKNSFSKIIISTKEFKNKNSI